MNTATILNGLITISKDSEQGFKKVAEEITENNLKTIFLDRMEGCKRAASELQEYVNKLGEQPTDSGSVLGMLHRGWIDIKSAISGRDNYAILAECERGEDVAKAAYTKALEADLPSDVRALLQKQFLEVKESHDLVRDLRDQHAPAK